MQRLSSTHWTVCLKPHLPPPAWMIEALKFILSPGVKKMISVSAHPSGVPGQAANTALAAIRIISQLMFKQVN